MDIAGVVLFAIVLAAVSWRLSRIMLIPGKPQESHAVGRNGLADYRDVMYLPVRAVAEGINPYDCDTETSLPDGSPRYRNRYPAYNIFPLYSPLVLLLYAPFAWFDFPTSAILYVSFNVVLLIVLAYVAWRTIDVHPSIAAVTTLAAIILATNAGRSNFLGGETALTLGLATLAAANYSRRNSVLTGLALAFNSFKPTIGLPLGILLLCRRDVRSVALGWGLGFVIAVAGLIIIFYRSGDLARMPAILRHNQQVVESEPHVDPRFSTARLDAAGAIERIIPGGRAMQLGASLIVLGIAGGSLWLLARNESLAAAELCRAIICLGTIGSMYHTVYDGVMLWAPIVSLAYARQEYWAGAPRWFRPALLTFLMVPMLNVLPTQTFVRALQRLGITAESVPAPWPEIGWTLACTLTGFAVLAALLLLAWQSWRLSRLALPNPVVG